MTILKLSHFFLQLELVSKKKKRGKIVQKVKMPILPLIISLTDSSPFQIKWRESVSYFFRDIKITQVRLLALLLSIEHYIGTSSNY